MDEEALDRALASGTTLGAETGLGVPMMGIPTQQQIPNFMYNVSAPGPEASLEAQHAQMSMQMPMRLPQAILQQYPTLSGIWDQLPTNGAAEEIDGEISGRNSFSSAGEFEEEEWSGPQGGAYGWASDVGP
jgi:transcription factor CRZ1